MIFLWKYLFRVFKDQNYLLKTFENVISDAIGSKYIFRVFEDKNYLLKTFENLIPDAIGTVYLFGIEDEDKICVVRNQLLEAIETILKIFR